MKIFTKSKSWFEKYILIKLTNKIYMQNLQKHYQSFHKKGTKKHQQSPKQGRSADVIFVFRL